MEFNDFLKEKMRNSRKTKNITQEKAAELTGIDFSYYRYLETGRSTPSVKTLLKIVKGLDITLDDMIYQTNVSPTYYSIEGMLKKCSEKDLKIIEGLIATIIKEKTAK